MNVCYNQSGIGDTLIINERDIDVYQRGFERSGDVVRIFDKETNETGGYNIFHASSYGTITDHGPVKLTAAIKQLIANAFRENDVTPELELEDKPSFVVGYVEEKQKHPNADKLNVCQVNVGKETLQIVCGAPNVEAGQKVVVALIGAVMPSGLKIKQAALRGVESSGMICSAKELALPNAPEEKGILVLSDDYQVGDVYEQSV
ncbi:YtpR family tRNA-binding protein [Halalkalibacter oceani]|uniref:DUF4479 domain-containing protein n=1 Tax=Halalkalibacter oceani TaxID=1653776 RepID=A0A9X2DTG1_9BACI|nr:DUF4479 domain-containing tRNA-binding protein [Halalkalibacter oceani]MCM3714988.1 DUF4479 domain-containing protein [Halalkalibacter oceani]